MTIARRPSSRTSQRSDPGPLSCSTFGRRTSSGGNGRGPIVPASRAGAARAAAILLISCHLRGDDSIDGNKHQRTLSDVAEGSNSIGRTINSQTHFFFFLYMLSLLFRLCFVFNNLLFFGSFGK